MNLFLSIACLFIGILNTFSGDKEIAAVWVAASIIISRIPEKK